jgi:hypothetical protein
VLIDLPLPGKGRGAACPQQPLSEVELQAQPWRLSDTDVRHLQQQGLSRDDALAALVMASGSVDQAEVVGGTARPGPPCPAAPQHAGILCSS